jgi:hypothetical protein
MGVLKSGQIGSEAAKGFGNGYGVKPRCLQGLGVGDAFVNVATPRLAGHRRRQGFPFNRSIRIWSIGA